MFSKTGLHSTASLFDYIKKKQIKRTFSIVNFFHPHSFCISIRSLSYDDLDMIYEWVNMPYAKRFWQMDGSKEQLCEAFNQVLKSKYTHSLIGLANNVEVCQVDIYVALHNDVSKFYKAGINDVGMHLLMAPPIDIGIRYLSLYVMQTMLEFLFSHPFIKNVVAEPDAENAKACRLLIRSGFTWVGNFRMTSKLAAIYTLNKEQFKSSPIITATNTYRHEKKRN